MKLMFSIFVLGNSCEPISVKLLVQQNVAPVYLSKIVEKQQTIDSILLGSLTFQQQGRKLCLLFNVQV